MICLPGIFSNSPIKGNVVIRGTKLVRTIMIFKFVGFILNILLILKKTLAEILGINNFVSKFDQFISIFFNPQGFHLKTTTFAQIKLSKRCRSVFATNLSHTKLSLWPLNDRLCR